MPDYSFTAVGKVVFGKTAGLQLKINGFCPSFSIFVRKQNKFILQELKNEQVV